MVPSSQARRERGSEASPVPLFFLQQPHITILAQRALSLAPEATSFREGMPLEASSEAEAGMPTPLTAATATSATTEAAAFRTAAEATEAARRGGRGVVPEAATGLAGIVGQPPSAQL
jgi:hypothetical protein